MCATGASDFLAREGEMVARSFAKIFFSMTGKERASLGEPSAFATPEMPARPPLTAYSRREAFGGDGEDRATGVVFTEVGLVVGGGEVTPVGLL
ncbi:MAG: hypothetical protein RLZZ15_2464, partial [Verrucomicrobiota bacterium]